MAHKSILFEHRYAISEILPHEIFRERESTEDNLVDDFKTGNVTYFSA